MKLSSVSLTFPPVSSLPEIRRVRLELSDGASTVATVGKGGPWTVHLPARDTTFLRLRILSTGRPTSSTAKGAAVADISIPGIAPAELIQTPIDLFDLARKAAQGLASFSGASITYLFERAAGGEELTLHRRFEVPVTAGYRLRGVVHLSRLATDAQIDRSLLGVSSVVVTSSSRLLGNPDLRGSAALDGNPSTAWIARGSVGEWIQAQFPTRTIDHLVIHQQPHGASNGSSRCT